MRNVVVEVKLILKGITDGQYNSHIPSILCQTPKNDT